MFGWMKGRSRREVYFSFNVFGLQDNICEHAPKKKEKKNIYIYIYGHNFCCNFNVVNYEQLKKNNESM